MLCNTAVFYDVENLTGLFHAKNGKNNKTLQLDEIHRRILELDLVQGISIQRAYADWALQINRNLRSYVLQIGIEPVQIFNTNQNDKVKNAADVSLIIDAVELLAKRPEIENYVIASGDGIFAFLAKKLHEHGKRVIGCGFDRNCNIIFKNSCDIYLSLEKSDASLTAVVKNSTKGTILNPAEALAETTATPTTKPSIPGKLPKNKFSEILADSDISIWKSNRDLPGSLHVLKRMINTLFEQTEPDVDLEISLFKAYMDHYLPGLRIGQYGFKRFGEFMRFLVSNSPYCLVISEGTVIRIARRNAFGKEANKEAKDDKDAQDKDAQMDDFPSLIFHTADGSDFKSLFDIDDGVSFTFELKAAGVTSPAIAGKTEYKINTMSIRKWIKDAFFRLSDNALLTVSELKRLQTEEYTKETFGIKIPLFKEIRKNMNINEERMVDGKVKYWKDEFKFKGKKYLVFKEWTDKQHRSNFEEWIKKIER